MPKGTNQKLKLYYLAKILLEKTMDCGYIAAGTSHLQQEKMS